MLSEKSLRIVLYENDNYYDQDLNKNFKELVIENYGEKVLQIIKNEQNDTNSKLDLINNNKFYKLYNQEILNLCLNFIQREVK